MNKDDLEKELKKAIKFYEEEKKNNAFLIREQKKYVEMAEKANNELAPYKHMVERLVDELNKLGVNIK